MTLLELMEATPKRPSLAEQLAEFFRAHPNEWLEFHRFAFAGFGGWRSRLSDLRRPPFNMTIENRQQRINGYTTSEYRYVPEP